MKGGNLHQVAIATASEAEESVALLLERLFGQPPSTYAEAETHRITVSVFLEDPIPTAKRKELMAGMREIKACGLALGSGKVSITRVRREDWSESWKRHFKPICLGRALMIRPSWSRLRARPGTAVVVLDPGLSFGTGQHATTSFCLRQLVSCHKTRQSQSFLDIGTGSGILAIAAAKLGYKPIAAFDNDPVAVRTAQANARRNRVLHRLTITRGDVTRLSANGRMRYDLVCANLIDTLLMDESARILGRLRSGGRLVLAGILSTQFASVQRVYEAAGLKLVETEIEREWRSGTFQG